MASGSEGDSKITGGTTSSDNEVDGGDSVLNSVACGSRPWNDGVVLCHKGTIYGVMSDLRTCPYNESHRVGTGKFAAHLGGCRKVSFVNFNYYNCNLD